MRTLASGSIDLNSLKVAGKPNKYITYVDSDNGIRVYDGTLSNGDQVNFVKINSDGMQIYKGGSDINNKIADFGLSVIIGQTNTSHLKIDYHSMQMIDKEGNVYFYISDLRDEEGYVTEYFIGDGSTTDFTLIGNVLSSSNLIVKVDDVVTTAYSMSDTRTLVFSTAPANGSKITVKYNPPNYTSIKAYTLGTREESSNVGLCSVAEGYNIVASGRYSHAEGGDTSALANFSHAEGNRTTASGMYSHAEGRETTASNKSSHAEGNYTTASGIYSHAEGDNTMASGNRSHAEGNYTTASNSYSHAEGSRALASGTAAHAEGHSTVANGVYSHAQNNYTIATEFAQTVIGKFNKATITGSGTDADPYIYSDVGDYAFIIGNGEDGARSNALTVDWQGNLNLPTGNFSGVGLALDYNSSKSNTNAISITNNTSNAFTVEWDGDVLAKGGINIAIEEIGSNYIRYSNGLQICWLNTNVNMAIDNQYGSSPLYTGTYTWTFPKAFSSAPTVTVGAVKWSTGGSWGSANAATTTSVVIRGTDYFSRASDKTTHIEAMAIGYWQ